MTTAITGMGAVASIGGNVDEFFAALCAGRTGNAPLRVFDTERYRSRNAYEIDDRPAGGPDTAMRTTTYLITAIEQALRAAGMSDDLSGVPVLVGTGLRELRSLELWHRDRAAFGPDDLHFGAALRAKFGALTTHTFSNACAASLYALAMGADLIEQRSSDVVVVAGVDMISESMFGLVERIHPKAPDVVRPFDRNRLGAVMGEGAAAVVLRRADPAADEATALLRGVGVNCDAYHVTAPSPAGMATAMRDAHRRAGVTPADVGLVMLHGTGTMLNDEAEATALADVFGPAARDPLMTATKCMTGHTSGASGLLGLITAVRALRDGVVPPTIGLDDLVDEAEGFRIVTGEQATHRARRAQVNAFGFGGINAVAIVEVDE
ncbi:beta-ketoacyl synthase [Actinoplanes sp. LDG1-06]|uniref:Beta-ketoacyl synthase n=1 Tax=Paractinoplanes ovalisporus TaxID=2810368 RepID=A0ABS2AI53_9ACTN|nr:beta-ketoacyl synthase N-terminal-like domain-containing protein [Actinoplanes ovalisporus]MBM2619524.1 beta-ketoacyl synthase [Actinoplanes ovalisporus]